MYLGLDVSGQLVARLAVSLRGVEMKKHFKDDDKAGVFIIWLIAALMVSLFLTVTSASASSTMHLVDQYHTSDALVCVYSDGRDYVNVERPRGSQHCPATYIDY